MSNDFIERLGARLRAGCEAAKVLGYTIAPGLFVLDKRCCPIGACMLTDPTQPGLDPDLYAKQALGLSIVDQDDFVRGFDRWKPFAVHGVTPYYELGKKLREEYAP